jgi:glycosyltransferase involved in cell wall biosynthesis
MRERRACIVGDTGAVVPPRDSEALAAALAGLVAVSPEERRRLGAATRARIRDKVSLGDVARRYERRPRRASDMAGRIAD